MNALENNYTVNEGDGAFYGPKIDIKWKIVLEESGRWELYNLTSNCQWDLIYQVHW